MKMKIMFEATVEVKTEAEAVNAAKKLDKMLSSYLTVIRAAAGVPISSVKVNPKPEKV